MLTKMGSTIRFYLWYNPPLTWYSDRVLIRVTVSPSPWTSKNCSGRLELSGEKDPPATGKDPGESSTATFLRGQPGGGRSWKLANSQVARVTSGGTV